MVWHLPWLPIIALGALGVVLLRTAWLCDDAYITLRTVDHLLAGYGPTWNPGERVQAYTHPLWMLLLTLASAVTASPYYAALGLGLCCSFLTAIGLARGAASPSAAAFAVLLLMLSRSFIDYSTSGLENPLTHGLLLLFVVAARCQKDTLRLGLASGILALSILNRMDCLLLLLPLFGYLFVVSPRKSRWWILPGLCPWLVWELFALIYYGSPLPNTAFAKLGSGLPRLDLARQGLAYFENAMRFDFITVVVLGAGLVVAWSSRDAISRMQGLGIVLYLAYVVSIGGDFMSGRFFSAPFFSAVLLLRDHWPRLKPWAAALSILIALVTGLAGPYPPLTSGSGYGAVEKRLDDAGIADERAFYYPYTGLFRDHVIEGRSFIHMEWADAGRRLRESAGAGGPVVSGNVGLLGFYAGPDQYIVDVCGLADPLLARLPATRTEDWRIGHFDRDLPVGYLESIASGENQIQDPQLAAFYDQVRRVTRGPLWGEGRFRAIWTFNTVRLPAPVH